MKYQHFLYFLIIFVLFFCFCGINADEKIELNVLMYPWVPDYDHIAKSIKENFEKEYPGVNIVIAKQNWNYYNPGGLDKKYDIYELDTIFLLEFVKKGRLQSLSEPDFLHIKSSFPFSIYASKVDGVLYGSPHWICALFLFYHKHDLRMKEATTLAKLSKAIGTRHEKGRGLLIDLNGTSTLAEIYVDCLVDMGYTQKEVLEQLASGILNKGAINSINQLVELCDPGIGRGILAHDAWPPYYPLEFAHGRGRALVGYSERMFHILSEIKDPSDYTPVINPSSISIRLFNQADKELSSLNWVDSFVIDASVKGKKLEYAKKFLIFMAQSEIYIKILLTNNTPQYLLPAYPNIYDSPKLLSAAPLYKYFKTEIQSKRWITLQGENIYKQLRQSGKKLNKKISLNLRPKDR